MVISLNSRVKCYDLDICPLGCKDMFFVNNIADTKSEYYANYANYEDHDI